MRQIASLSFSLATLVFPTTLLSLMSSNHERVVIFDGRIPLKAGDVVVGALGASRGTVDQDVEVAEAAAAVFKATR